MAGAVRVKTSAIASASSPTRRLTAIHYRVICVGAAVICVTTDACSGNRPFYCSIRTPSILQRYAMLNMAGLKHFMISPDAPFLSLSLRTSHPHTSDGPS